MLLQPLHQHPSQGQVQVSRQFSVTSIQPEQEQQGFIPQQHSNLQVSNALLQPMHQQLSQGYVQVPGQPYGNLLEQQEQQPPQLGPWFKDSNHLNYKVKGSSHLN